MIPALAGAPAIDAHRVAPALAPFKGHRMARAVLEMAVLDAELRARGVPLGQALGAVRDTVPCGLSVGIMESTHRGDARQLARFDPFDLVMSEQLLAEDDLIGHAELAYRISTPICLDESIVSARAGARRLPGHRGPGHSAPDEQARQSVVQPLTNPVQPLRLRHGVPPRSPTGVISPSAL